MSDVSTDMPRHPRMGGMNRTCDLTICFGTPDPASLPRPGRDHEILDAEMGVMRASLRYQGTDI